MGRRGRSGNRRRGSFYGFRKTTPGVGLPPYNLERRSLLMRKLMLLSTVCLTLTAGTTALVPAPVELKAGDKAPDFSLPGTDGKTHKLADYKGKTVVLAWFPAAFTGGCTAECRSIRDASDTIAKYDVAYFMASVDTP